jgi:hypothetical protein
MIGDLLFRAALEVIGDKAKASTHILEPQLETA